MSFVHLSKRDVFGGWLFPPALFRVPVFVLTARECHQSICSSKCSLILISLLVLEPGLVPIPFLSWDPNYSQNFIFSSNIIVRLHPDPSPHYQIRWSISLRFNLCPGHILTLSPHVVASFFVSYSVPVPVSAQATAVVFVLPFYYKPWCFSSLARS